MDYKYVMPSRRVRRPGEPVIFAYLGVVSRFKGIDLLIDSFKKVKSSNIRLHIYGNCVGDDGTIDLLREAEIEDIRIRGMGRV